MQEIDTKLAKRKSDSIPNGNAITTSTDSLSVAALQAMRTSLAPSAIAIGPRHRKDLGDITSLAISIQQNGLLHLPVVSTDNVLIAGARRLEAWRLLKGDSPIPVRIIPLGAAFENEDVKRERLLNMEYAENADRKDFAPSEIVAIKRALEPNLKAEAKARSGSRTDLRANSPEVETDSTNVGKQNSGRALDKLGAFVGKDRKTIAKMEAVVAAAEADPEKFGKLVEDMDRTGNVNGPFKRLSNITAAEKIKAEPPGLPMNGPYYTGGIDYPWASESGGQQKDHSARGYYPYPTLAPERAVDFRLADILHANASVWVWIPNHHDARSSPNPGESLELTPCCAPHLDQEQVRAGTASPGRDGARDPDDQGERPLSRERYQDLVRRQQRRALPEAAGVLRHRREAHSGASLF
jgi:hypothetical protein